MPDDQKNYTSHEAGKQTRFTLPESRLINSSFFARDIYKDPKTNKEGDPEFKCELAFDPKDITGAGTIEDEVIEVACQEWGDGAEQDVINGTIMWNRSGDDMAANREAAGKEGDAYRGKLVLRCHTKYDNAGNEDGAGRIDVYDEQGEFIESVNKDLIFNGCYGQVAITLKATEVNRNRYVTPYLVAFMKTGGDPTKDRLSSSADTSTLFPGARGRRGGGASSGGDSEQPQQESRRSRRTR